VVRLLSSYPFPSALSSPLILEILSIEKLLEHLNKWTEPAKIAATKIWKEGEDIKIAAHIIHIFHLLPSAAVKFLG